MFAQKPRVWRSRHESKPCAAAYEANRNIMILVNKLPMHKSIINLLLQNSGASTYGTRKTMYDKLGHIPVKIKAFISYLGLYISVFNSKL